MDRIDAQMAELQLLLPCEEALALEHLAAQSGVSVAKVVRELICRALHVLSNEEEVPLTGQEK